MISYASMSASDGAHCVRLIRKLWGDKAATRAIHQLSQMWDYDLMAGDRPEYVVAKDGDTIIGVAGFRRSWIMESTYELVWVAVEPEYHGRGIGRQLIEICLDRIRQRGGKLVLCMTKEVDFFRKMGFTDHRGADGYSIMSRGIGNIGVEIDGRKAARDAA